MSYAKLAGEKTGAYMTSVLQIVEQNMYYIKKTNDDYVLKAAVKIASVFTIYDVSYSTSHYLTLYKMRHTTLQSTTKVVITIISLSVMQ